MEETDRYRINSYKLDLHPERVSDWLASKPVTPIYVEISPVGYCNHRCTFCALDFLGYEKHELGRAELFRFLRYAKDSGVKSVMFGGEGEPTLHPYFHSVCTFARLLDLSVGVTTNGTNVFPCLIESCEWIKISVNAGDDATYKRIHKCREYEYKNVWRNIDNMLEYRRHHGGGAIGVQSVLLHDNANSMESLAKQCAASGVDYLVIKPYSSHPKSRRKFQVRYHQCYDLQENLKKYNTDTFAVIWRVDEREYRPSVCYALPFWAYLDSRGDIWQCSTYIGDKRFFVGNIYKEYEDIWPRVVNPFTDIKDCRSHCRMSKCNQYLQVLQEIALESATKS